MTLNVVTLPARPDECAEVVARLKELLAEAERGEIVGIAYVYVNKGRDVLSWGRRGLGQMESIGMADRLRHNFQTSWDRDGA